MDCLFCKIIAGEIPSTKIYEDEDVYAFADITPQAPVHALFVPKRHIASLAEASADDAALLGKLLLAAAKVARDKGLGDGYRTVFNTGARAGQTVFHVHLHLLGGRDMTWPPG